MLNYLTGYRLRTDGSVGFPKTALDKVIKIIEYNELNYKIIYKDHEPIIKEIYDTNNYNDILNKALEHSSKYIRIKRIKEKINDIDDLEKLERIIWLIEHELQ